MNIGDPEGDSFEIKNSNPQLEKKISEIDKQIKNFSSVAWIFVAVGFLMFVAGIFIFILYPSYTDFLSKYGGFIGGSVSSFWSLAGLFFIYVAFLGQKQQLYYQQEEIKNNYIELKLTRDEIAGQRIQMIEQNKTFDMQRFENTFFQLLNFQNEIIQEFDLGKGIKGRNCFKEIYANFRTSCTTGQSNRSTITMDMATKSYMHFYDLYESLLGHYFRNLFQVVIFVDASSIENKTRYIDFLKSQLCKEEILLLFYYGICENRRETIYPLIVKYNLVVNINSEFLINTKHANAYS